MKTSTKIKVAKHRVTKAVRVLRGEHLSCAVAIMPNRPVLYLYDGDILDVKLTGYGPVNVYHYCKCSAEQVADHG